MRNFQKKQIDFITNFQQLHDSIQFLNQQNCIAFDLEFDSNRYTYGFTLCLVQIATTEKCYVIDPFCFGDEELRPLFQLFENPNIQKVIHSAGEDLRMLQRLGYRAKNLFDTQVAVQLLGYEKISLANIITDFLEIELNKKQQDSNWTRRPLSDDQLDYAANDVCYLLELKERIEEQLDGKIQEDWFEQEMEVLENLRFSDEKKDPISRGDRKHFSPQQLNILRGFLEFRESLAQEMNKPVYQIFRDEYAREVVQNPTILKNWVNNQQSPRSLRTFEFQQRLQRAYSNILEISQSQLIEKQPKTATDWRASVVQKQKNEEVYSEIFKPIKAYLADKYNAFVSTNTLSKDAAMQLLDGRLAFAEIKTAYRKELILEATTALAIDLENLLPVFPTNTPHLPLPDVV